MGSLESRYKEGAQQADGQEVMGAIHYCHNKWLCCPGPLRLFILFVIGNILGDIISFPFAHTFWNLFHFEGWFAND